MAGDQPTVRRLPAPDDGLGRVESGPIQIGEDWPGLFVRGDNAFGVAMSIKAVLTYFEDHPQPEIAFALNDLMYAWADCVAAGIEPFA